MNFAKQRYFLRKVCSICLPLFALLLPSLLTAQTMGSLSGKVLDPTGALIPNATIALTQGAKVLTATSTSDGSYHLKSIPSGTYQLTIDALGFAHFSNPQIVITGARQLNISLSVYVEQEHVNVTSENAGISVSSDENANTAVLKDKDLDALSDDPDELLTELKALAGPAAGPDGGQIYIDGFSGGQLPPKSSILEVRINQNPFSAEYDRIGYGRINILTKPGSSKLAGDFRFSILNSALDTSNPLVTVQPAYQYYSVAGDMTGPFARSASYFFSGHYWERENQSVINAIDPNNTATTIKQSVPAPYSTMQLNPRIDFQFGKNIISIRNIFYRTRRTGAGVGALVLPEQAYSNTDQENALQLQDSIIVNSHLINEVSLQWRRVRINQTPDYFLPEVIVQGVFQTGGSSIGQIRDHQDLFEFHNYATLTAGSHVMRLGALLRSSRDANFSTGLANGSYSFQSIEQYAAKKPSLYQSTVIANPLARILMFDGAIFFQDEWRLRPNLNFSYGLRVEGQSRIHDPVNWAPRATLTWAPGESGKAPRIAFHAGAGIFYNRFGMPSLVQAIHYNGVNQQTYVVQNPNFYDPNTAIPPNVLSQASSFNPQIYTLDRHFHASENIQGAMGVDRTLGKLMLSVNYLYTRGVHQYLTNNISAPIFDPGTYTVTGPAPTSYNYQFQSGGLFKQHQIIVTARARLKKLTFYSGYTFNDAKSDTQGVSSFPSIAQNPRADYGRATFGVTHQLQLAANYTGPFGITFAPFLLAQSGTPYNITLGPDLTQNNRFNARPTYGTCGAPDVISTSLGCLDSNPTGKGESIIPYNLGTGPANVVLNLNITKHFGIGPRREAAGSNMQRAGAMLHGTPGKSAPSAPRRYSLSLTLGATNLFNMVNLAPPNGLLGSPLFGRSQSVAGGFFTSPSPGNRTVYLNTAFFF